MKSIELTQSQIKAKENGATMFIFTLNKNINILNIKDGIVSFINNWSDYYDEINIEKFTKRYSPLQIGDKDVFVKEEFIYSSVVNQIAYKAQTIGNLREDLTQDELDDFNTINWKPASQMTKEQSRYSFKEILDVEVIRVQDIGVEDYLSIFPQDDLYWNATTFKDKEEDFKDFYNQQMQDLGIDKTYENNNYVFLIEVDRGK